MSVKFLLICLKPIFCLPVSVFENIHGSPKINVWVRASIRISFRFKSLVPRSLYGRGQIFWKNARTKDTFFFEMEYEPSCSGRRNRFSCRPGFLVLFHQIIIYSEPLIAVHDVYQLVLKTFCFTAIVCRMQDVHFQLGKHFWVRAFPSHQAFFLHSLSWSLP